MELFHAFGQPIASCVPLLNEKAASVAMSRHGMDIQHNVTILNLGSWLAVVAVDQPLFAVVKSTMAVARNSR